MFSMCYDSILWGTNKKLWEIDTKDFISFEFLCEMMYNINVGFIREWRKAYRDDNFPGVEKGKAFILSDKSTAEELFRIFNQK